MSKGSGGTRATNSATAHVSNASPLGGGRASSETEKRFMKADKLEKEIAKKEKEVAIYQSKEDVARSEYLNARSYSDEADARNLAAHWRRRKDEIESEIRFMKREIDWLRSGLVSYYGVGVKSKK